MTDKYNKFREWVKKSKYGFIDTQEMELESDKKIFEKFETECDKVFLRDFKLKKENDELSVWKSACAKSDNENAMLKKELFNAIEQGYELSNSYREYLEEKEKDMLKHYSDKRRITKRGLIK